ncbi:MAG: DNA methyltransferase [Candidatus Tenebribacter davisii]|nr:DNA methyltransferase [Candidatus Tenebribacter davisii]
MLDLFDRFENEDKKNKKVICLGIEFDSEEKRREYFREELRKKLPELKKMEGFPIGEDDDIINLSDPPYYTACPNPWLNDFIYEWEREKKELEKQEKRNADFEVTEPYASDVSEGKNNPIYNAHSYHTKVPHPAIMRYILHYTQPGDIVFDGFAGTGMTGVAASLCGNPEPQQKILFERINSQTKWGERKAICSDLSPIASLINAIYNVSGEHRKYFYERALSKVNYLEKKYGWMYNTKHDDGSICKINYIVWSEVFLCPNCNSNLNFWENAVNGNDVLKEFNCPNCGSLLDKRKLEKKWITAYNEDSRKTTKILAYEPVFVNYKIGTKSYERPINIFDTQLIDRVNNLEIGILKQLNNSFDQGDKTREFFNKGINKLKDLYTKRTMILLSELFRIFETKEEKALFTATIVNLSKTARYKFKRSGNVPMSGTIYISSLIAESNVFNSIKSKIKAHKKAYQILGNNQKNINGINSATSLNNIKTDSIDYIFVDPPFGANLMYSELSSHWENWLNVKTNTTKEAIENRTQKKSKFDYQTLIQESFKEFYRILKPGKWMTIEFSNTSAAIWNSIQTAVQNTGFIVSNVASLDKKQGSYNAVMNPTSVKQDLVITCYKPSSTFDLKFQKNKNVLTGVWDFIAEHLKHLPIHIQKKKNTTEIIERSPRILFDRLISFYVTHNLPVPIDAADFQKGLRERFEERDGMFFTHEQLLSYEEKKKEFPEYVQASIFVASEQDGIYWLKLRLEKEKMNYQDIQPDWMQSLAAVRKGDTIPELMTILEENFLKDDEGRWYYPDPENLADLEKLRHRRLMREFELYLDAVNKPKAKKIKEVRVEALRAGFKECYQRKDFETIVKVAEIIPQNLLLEDEFLLQFYDIAMMKV